MNRFDILLGPPVDLDPPQPYSFDGNAFGYSIRVDATLQPGVIEFRDSHGQVHGIITETAPTRRDAWGDVLRRWFS